MQLYRRVQHLFKTRIFLNLSLTNRPLFRTFIGPFDFFKHVVGTGALRLNFFCKKKLFEEAQTELSGNFYSSREKIQIKNFH